MKSFFLQKSHKSRELQVFRSDFLLPNQKREIAERLKMAMIGAEYSKFLSLNTTITGDSTCSQNPKY